MPENIAIVSLDDLKVLLAENEIKNEVWDTEQAANYLRLAVSTVKRQAAKGTIPAVKIGDKWKFSSIALYEFVRGNQKQNGGRNDEKNLVSSIGGRSADKC
ncbi:helix-turn-helix domain-containing protein [Enterococcus asini]|uniref:helix-turn-helix domain-containing protein n=1 Tax=Enterococcus asini TaxID=57732 RepID=UPI0022E8A544|nr:helix-turn-helix domain-containing protein [Enterococcus asini]